MRILVDADACPKAIKEILYRAANKRLVTTIFYANQRLTLPPSAYLKFVQVPSGFDVADNYIVQAVEKNDLVITADIPLASQSIAKGGYALNPRGEFYTQENIQQKLSVRNLMEGLRETGQISGGPSPLHAKHCQAFANALDRFLTKHH